MGCCSQTLAANWASLVEIFCLPGRGQGQPPHRPSVLSPAQLASLAVPVPSASASLLFIACRASRSPTTPSWGRPSAVAGSTPRPTATPSTSPSRQGPPWWAGTGGGWGVSQPRPVSGRPHLGPSEELWPHCRQGDSPRGCRPHRGYDSHVSLGLRGGGVGWVGHGDGRQLLGRVPRQNCPHARCWGWRDGGRVGPGGLGVGRAARCWGRCTSRLSAHRSLTTHPCLPSTSATGRTASASAAASPPSPGSMVRGERLPGVSPGPWGNGVGGRTELQIQGLPRPPTGAISCPSPPLLAGTTRGKVLRTWGLQRPPGGFSHPSLSLGVHRGAGRIMRKDYVQRCLQGRPAVQHRWPHVAI